MVLGTSLTPQNQPKGGGVCLGSLSESAQSAMKVTEESRYGGVHGDRTHSS